jgi:hypothetical protein
MSLDIPTLSQLRKTHPAWRLLMADHAPLIAGFLHRVFIVPNVRVIPEGDLISRLEDDLFKLRETEGAGSFPRSAVEYLDEWARNDKGWLRKYYPPDSDEAHYDLTPAVEKALGWLEGLTQRMFVGTESRLMTIFELLRQMVAGVETDAETRIRELEQRRDEINRQIERIRTGDLEVLDETSLKDRFQQVSSTARELLGDFREVEHNFRQLDRNVREQIATWDGRKGDLLERIFGERDAIADSDQGKSFRAFWDFLMAPARQEELSLLLEKVFAMEAVISMQADVRLKRIHYDWLEAGEHTQRTVAKLSQQLRRYLDDQVYLENRRIIQLLQGIELSALAVREQGPAGPFMYIDEPAPEVNLPLERPLYVMPIKSVVLSGVEAGDGADINLDMLYGQMNIDRTQLQANIRKMLQTRSQVTLLEITREHPLKHGLAELISYFTIAGADPRTVFDETETDSLSWSSAPDQIHGARVPRVIFNR